MTHKTDTYAYLLSVLEEGGHITKEQAQSLKLRQWALQQSIQKDKHLQREKRYDVSPIEIVAAANLTSPKGQVLDETSITQILAKNLEFSFVHIDPLKLDSKLITESFSHAFARANAILPLRLEGDTMTIATSAFTNPELMANIRTGLRYQCIFVAATKSDILRNIAEIYGFKSSVKAAAIEQSTHALPSNSLGNLEQLVSVRQVDEIDASDSHVINAVDYLLNYALAQRASDIHIEAKRSQSVVRLRIDGILHTAYTLPIAVHAPIISRLKMLARLDIAEKRRPQDGRIKVDHGSQEIELRVSTMPVTFGEKLVIRILDSATHAVPLEDLGMSSAEYAIYSRFIHQTTGLILVTGPTGSGKTTTLYSSLEAIYSPSLNIITIEDPVEIINEKFNQVPVQNKIQFDFQAALRTVLRQDPDVIMVGEIRDEETAHMAVQAALTGHLVFSTLHTNDAPSAITRLLDLRVKPFLLASSLLGVVAQRLVRTICPHCKVSHELTANEIAALGLKQSSSQRRALPTQKGAGCPHCRQSGIYGQSAIFEILNINANMRKLVHDSASAEALRKTAIVDGMVSLRENAIRQLAQGTIAFEEVVRVVGKDI